MVNSLQKINISESLVTKAIRSYAPLLRVVLFRNNVVAFEATNGKKSRYIKAGFGPGSSDLIGYATTTITKDMVGKDIAVFTAVEVKKSSWNHNKKFNKHEKEQKEFIDRIKLDGGIAGFSNCVDDLINLIKGK